MFVCLTQTNGVVCLNIQLSGVIDSHIPEHAMVAVTTLVDDRHVGRAIPGRGQDEGNLEVSGADVGEVIGARQGVFPGMLQKRTFKIVFVTQGHGVDVADTASPDQTVTYNGTSVAVKAP